jgi:outer membrane protein OmpA-like peptidoglycan-associated protein
MRTKLLSFILVLTILSSGGVMAQSTEGRVAFGFNFGLNKLYGDFRDNQFWLQGDLFARWNIIDYLSLHVGYNGGQMRMKPNDDNIKLYPNYFGQPNDKFYPTPGNPSVPTDVEREEKNKIRHGGIQAMLGFNMIPHQAFVPWIGAGVEMLNFEPRNLNQDKALPYFSYVKYEKDVIGAIFGLGFELYLSDNVVFNAKGVYHATGTPWLDDFTEEAYKAYSTNGTNAVIDKEAGTADAFLTFGIGFSYYVFGDQDADKDGLRDGAERDIYKTDPENPDTDGDGLKDGEEVNTYKTDPLKADTDGDALTDPDEIRIHYTNPVMPDADADGLNDGEEVTAYKTKPTEADTDGDGIPDGQEVKDHKTDPLKVDSDGDGLNDGDELKKLGTSPIKIDTDGDGLNDGDEINVHKTDAAKDDTDGDTVSDGQEVNTYKTNPLNPDTDGDGLIDGDEIKYGSDPHKADSDGDGLNDNEEIKQYKTNPAKADSDMDGWNDKYEATVSLTSPLLADSDADGVADPKDKCPLTKGAAPDGCPPKPKVETVTNFPGVIFIVNTDNFDLSEPSTMENLQKIRGLVEQCPDIKVEIEGHASSEGEAKRNQELSDLRAARVKSWLIEQGVKAEKITKTIGYGSSKPYIPEPKLGKKVTAKQVEAARKQNRRIAVRVVETCK